MAEKNYVDYKVLWVTPINVLSRQHQPGDRFSVLKVEAKENKRELAALVKNKYIEEIK